MDETLTSHRDGKGWLDAEWSESATQEAGISAHDKTRGRELFETEQ
jgi:branched-subunit amino acid aminotransferase/4-amino-4-deoxychorismate lyase